MVARYRSVSGAPRFDGDESPDGRVDSVHSILIGRLTKQRLSPLSATPLDARSVSSTPRIITPYD